MIDGFYLQTNEQSPDIPTRTRTGNSDASQVSVMAKRCLRQLRRNPRTGRATERQFSRARTRLLRCRRDEKLQLPGALGLASSTYDSAPRHRQDIERSVNLVFAQEAPFQNDGTKILSFRE